MTVTASVVIPMHNAGDVVVEQLDAVLRGLPGHPHTEILVVDNRSTDHSRSVVETWARRTGAPLRVVPADEKAGEPFARNVGWQAARGEAILFCDADDVVGSRWLSSLTTALQHHRYATGPLDTSLLNDPRIVDLRGQALFRSLPRLAGGTPFAHGCNMGFRRDALESLGGFDESFLIGCDIEIAVRAWRDGIRLVWEPDALVHYRLRSTPGEVFRQARGYGRSRRRIAAMVDGPGGGDVDWWHQLRRTAWLARHAPGLARFGGRMEWAWVAGQVTGELEGRRPWN